MNLKEKVEFCLKQYPETRNSDIALTIQIWREFHSILDSIKVNDLYNLPREDNIKRIRAHFQNYLKKYLPTNLEIALKRGFLEDEWRQLVGYPPKVKAGQGALFNVNLGRR